MSNINNGVMDNLLFNTCMDRRFAETKDNLLVHVIDNIYMTVSPMLEDSRNRPSVQIGWFKNRRNMLEGTKMVYRNQIFVGVRN
jgi:hypothetical protein